MFGSFYNQGQKVIDKQGPLGQIWISGFSFAHNIEKLQKNHIKAMVSGVDLNHKYPQSFQRIKFNLNDSQDQKVSHKKTNVLVHCAAGISRCSVILISYLMRKYRWSFEKCLDKLKAARPCCQPNMGFTKQLKIYEKELQINM